MNHVRLVQRKLGGVLSHPVTRLNELLDKVCEMVFRKVVMLLLFR